MSANNRGFRFTLFASICALVASMAGVVAADNSVRIAPVQLNYRVTHSVFGDIGTYTNTIEPTADGAKVKTQAHFQVTKFGLNLYREDAQRTERWRGNRLISFHSVTSKGSTAPRSAARRAATVSSFPRRRGR